MQRATSVLQPKARAIQQKSSSGLGGWIVTSVFNTIVFLQFVVESSQA